MKFSKTWIVAALVLASTLATVASAAGNLVIEPTTFEPVSGTPVAAELGTLVVPENRQATSQRTIALKFVRFPSTAKKPGPPIVYLAGGPGGSGIEAAKGPRFPTLHGAARDRRRHRARSTRHGRVGAEHRLHRGIHDSVREAARSNRSRGDLRRGHEEVLRPLAQGRRTTPRPTRRPRAPTTSTTFAGRSVPRRSRSGGSATGPTSRSRRCAHTAITSIVRSSPASSRSTTRSSCRATRKRCWIPSPRSRRATPSSGKRFRI